VDASEGEKLLPAFYDRARRAQPGELTRDPETWRAYFRDAEWHRRGDSRHYDAVYEDDSGRVEGWASYRVRHHWAAGLPANVVRVRGLYALTPAARTAVSRYCLDLDLAGSVELMMRPLDEPLRWMLADSRRLQATHTHDGLWVRLVDLPAALAARRYAVEDRLVLEVTDRIRSRNQGRFALEGGGDGASCRPTRDDPDLTLDVAWLGATYLGGVRFTTLARAGRVLERTRGAARRADLLFSSDPAPWCTTTF